MKRVCTLVTKPAAGTQKWRRIFTASAKPAHIIDLVTTVEALDKALPFLTKVAGSKQVLFVGAVD